MEFTTTELKELAADEVPCPNCGKPNIIYRKWLDDFWCGWCRAEFEDSRLIEKATSCPVFRMEDKVLL